MMKYWNFSSLDKLRKFCAVLEIKEVINFANIYGKSIKFDLYFEFVVIN